MASTVLFFLVLYLHDRVFMGDATKNRFQKGFCVGFRQLQVLMVSMALDPHGIVFLAYALAVR